MQKTKKILLNSTTTPTTKTSIFIKKNSLKTFHLFSLFLLLYSFFSLSLSKLANETRMLLKFSLILDIKLVAVASSNNTGAIYTATVAYNTSILFTAAVVVVVAIFSI